MNYLSRDDLLDLHMVAIERFGGRLGIRSQDRLLAVVSAPQQIMFGTELYPDLPGKVAVIGFMILKNRPFNSANEATALLAMLRVLAVNDVAWNDGFPQQLAVLMQGILQSDVTQDEFATWLRGMYGAHMFTVR